MMVLYCMYGADWRLLALADAISRPGSTDLFAMTTGRTAPRPAPQAVDPRELAAFASRCFALLTDLCHPPPSRRIFLHRPLPLRLVGLLRWRVAPCFVRFTLPILFRRFHTSSSPNDITAPGTLTPQHPSLSELHHTRTAMQSRPPRYPN